MQEIPVLEKLHNDLGKKGLQIVAVSVDKNRESLDAFLKRQRLPYLVVHDSSSTTRSAYGGHSIPLTVVIDRQGKVVRMWHGCKRSANPVFNLVIVAVRIPP
jgi:peroxiredoxin